MDEKLIERCTRICGEAGAKCFVDDSNQLQCIADIVSNKAYVISLILETARQEQDTEAALGHIDKAQRVANELGNWVKFLLLTHDLRELCRLADDTKDPERRHEVRYRLPEVYQRYIVLEVGRTGVTMPVRLINFGQNGLQFAAGEPVEVNAYLECTLTTDHPVGKELAFVATVKYCYERDGEFIVGARVEETSDRTTLNFFNNVFEFLKERT